MSNSPTSIASSVSAIRLCGNQKCEAKLTGAMRRICGGCKARTYCSKDCQSADWPSHATPCLRNLILAKDVRDDEIAKKFSYKHTPALISLALSLLNIENLPYGSLRDSIWLAQCQRFIPLIIVQQIPRHQRPRAQHNYVRYISAVLEKLDLLDKKRPCADNIRHQLNMRHPAVAYAILTYDFSGSEVCLTTFTHPITPIFNAIIPKIPTQFYTSQLLDSIVHAGGLI